MYPEDSRGDRKRERKWKRKNCRTDNKLGLYRFLVIKQAVSFIIRKMYFLSCGDSKIYISATLSIDKNNENLLRRKNKVQIPG